MRIKRIIAQVLIANRKRGMARKEIEINKLNLARNKMEKETGINTRLAIAREKELNVRIANREAKARLKVARGKGKGVGFLGIARKIIIGLRKWSQSREY